MPFEVFHHDSEKPFSMKLPNTLRAFRSYNYRLFFAGQSVSLVGSWMQQVALGWLVYRLTSSPWYLGLVGFLDQIPIFLLAPFGGVLSDRFDRRKVLLVSQTLALLQAFLLALLVISNNISMEWIFLLAFMLGIANALDVPTRQAFVLDMIDRPEDLGNAIALNSSMVNMARFLGPMLAGWIIVAVGEGLCFLLNALSYLSVIGSLMMMRTKKRVRVAPPQPFFTAFKEGFAYTFGFLPLRTIVMYLGLISLVGVPYQTLAPAFARDVFHGGPHTLGIMMASSGVGALTGALYLASRKSVLGLGRHIRAAGLLFGVALVAYALSSAFWISLCFLGFVGFGMIVQMASSNTLLQMIAEEDKRGRVMSFFAMSFRGMVPFGSLLAGTLAAHFGAPETVLMGGLAALLGTAWFSWELPKVRVALQAVYQKKGFLKSLSG